MANNHGGKREGAGAPPGSGGKREGAGRPRRKWDAGERGQVWFVEISKPDGFPAKPQQWRFLGIDEAGSLEFQNVKTEEIISIIHPDKYE